VNNSFYKACLNQSRVARWESIFTAKLFTEWSSTEFNFIDVTSQKLPPENVWVDKKAAMSIA
jgi:hypothetical protein